MVIKLDKFWESHYKDKKKYEHLTLVDLRYRYIKKCIQNKGKILDLGFGTGYFLKKLSEDEFETYGFDLPRKNIGKISKQFSKKIKLNFGRIKNLPYQNSFFDYVISSEVFEHLTKKEMILAFKKIYGMLKKEGKLIITVPSNENLIQNYMICPYCSKEFHPFLHKQSFDKNYLIKFGYKMGFRKIHIIPFLTFLDFFYRLPFGLRFLISQLSVISKILKPSYILAIFEK